MRSTFMGLETAKRGMFTQQSALYTTGHNISNANTPGYSRQRVNFQTTTPYPAVGLNRPNIPGQMGTGVEAGSVQRIRDSFIDVQYRNENNKLGYWSARADAFTKVEDIVNEPSTEGLAATMSELWESLQVLSTSAENDGARSVVIERLQSVTDTFNYMADSLNAIKKDFGDQTGVTIEAANGILKQLFDVNQQIAEIEPNGYLPNDLYDRRDLLVDELSQYMNISIEIEKMSVGGNSLDIAEGVYRISLMNDDGSGIMLMDQNNYKQISFSSTDAEEFDVPADSVSALYFHEYEYDKEYQLTGAPVETVDFANGTDVVFARGEIRGLIESYGYKHDPADATEDVKGIYSDVLDKLDKLAFSLGTMFNDIFKLGYDMTGAQATEDVFELPIDYKNAASEIKFNEAITPEKIAASTTGSVGNAQNALNLANIGSMLLSDTAVELLGGGTYDANGNSEIKSGTLNSFYESVIGTLGVDSKQAKRMEENVTVLKDSVVTNRNSISSVSLDEEMTNLIQFQHAYNGAARMITVVDEMLDKIINGMGVGGR
ncbi:flagellar hook-associated protein FlgK [Domibacillus iocasae]|uniref:Flagellar hook-associated protein 1 n=1 Tax=Domibacillus iocasae TaxID=1714016 RepID=A0A1E7DSQ2_9BACI|nr:flagellar hook-associated protein FlgK [Domibacillus iocasae]OES46049.1 flagellar hook-associated protein FlgK [Domibacillus iocasae]